MGADLICSHLEIQKDKEPDWDAAEKHIDSLSDEACVEAYGDMQQVNPEDVEDMFDMDADDCREKIKDSFNTLKEAWDGGYRCIITLDLAATTLFLAADRTWGDPIEEVDAMNLFIASGAHKAAGFLDGNSNSMKLTINTEEVK